MFLLNLLIVAGQDELFVLVNVKVETMSSFTFDVYSDFFTPQEFPVEILNVAKTHDVVACCLPAPAKNFLALMLFKEFYYE